MWKERLRVLKQEVPDYLLYSVPDVAPARRDDPNVPCRHFHFRTLIQITWNHVICAQAVQEAKLIVKTQDIAARTRRSPASYGGRSVRLVALCFTVVT
jgi:hypothetical protein